MQQCLALLCQPTHPITACYSVNDHLLTSYEATLRAVLATQLGPRGFPAAEAGLYELLEVSPQMRELMGSIYGLSEDEMVRMLTSCQDAMIFGS